MNNDDDDDIDEEQSEHVEGGGNHDDEEEEEDEGMEEIVADDVNEPKRTKALVDSLKKQKDVMNTFYVYQHFPDVHRGSDFMYTAGYFHEDVHKFLGRLTVVNVKNALEDAEISHTFKTKWIEAENRYSEQTNERFLVIVQQVEEAILSEFLHDYLIPMHNLVVRRNVPDWSNYFNQSFQSHERRSIGGFFAYCQKCLEAGEIVKGTNVLVLGENDKSKNLHNLFTKVDVALVEYKRRLLSECDDKIKDLEKVHDERLKELKKSYDDVLEKNQAETETAIKSKNEARETVIQLKTDKANLQIELGKEKNANMVAVDKRVMEIKTEMLKRENEFQLSMNRLKFEIDGRESKYQSTIREWKDKWERTKEKYDDKIQKLKDAKPEVGWREKEKALEREILELREKLDRMIKLYESRFKRDVLPSLREEREDDDVSTIFANAAASAAATAETRLIDDDEEEEDEGQDDLFGLERVIDRFGNLNV